MLAPVGIIDDDINEADEQMFVVHLEVMDALHLTTPENIKRNTSICRIMDNDRKYHNSLLHVHYSSNVQD